MSSSNYPTGAKKKTAAPADADNDANNVDPRYLRLGDTYLHHEKTIKIEMAMVGFLWLVGCPILCILTSPSSSLGEGEENFSMWGTPDPTKCGLYTYSISASMTGLLPKTIGSILVTLLCVLVVQRTSQGMCGVLKLGWMARFSHLVKLDHRDESNSSPAFVTRVQEENRSNTQNEITKTTTALKLWRHILRIEYMGYVAGGMLISLVSFDSKHFLHLHCWLALGAFFALYEQNRLVGALGNDFPTLFPNWTNQLASRVFVWGMMHLMVFLGLHFVFGIVVGYDRCNTFLETPASILSRWNPSETRLLQMASVAFWYLEYAFVILGIYVQLLPHYEMKLWEFVGSESMPYAAILSRCSVTGVINNMLRCRGSRSCCCVEEEANVFLGNKKNNNEDVVLVEKTHNERQS